MRVLERWMHLQLLSLLRWFEKLNFNQSWKHLHSSEVGLWDPPKTHEVTQCKCGQTPCDKIGGLFHFFLALNFRNKQQNASLTTMWTLKCDKKQSKKKKTCMLHHTMKSKIQSIVKYVFLCHSYCKTMKTSSVNRDEAEQIFWTNLHRVSAMQKNS